MKVGSGSGNDPAPVAFVEPPALPSPARGEGASSRDARLTAAISNNWIPQHLVNPRRARRQHDQAVKAERDAGRFRHRRQRRQKILVERIALAVDAFFLRHLAFEPAPLLGGVGELGEAVGEFDAADINLEAFGDARIFPRRARQRRLLGGIFVQNGRAPNAEIALDALHQHAAENIAPAVVVGNANAGRLRGAGEQRAVGLAVRQGRQQIDAGEFFKRFRHRQPFRRGKRIGGAAAKAELFCCRLRRLRQNRGAVGHQRLVRLTRAIPFDQREFRRVQRAALTVAEHFCEFDDAAFPGGEQLLAGEFRRGAQIKRRCRAVRRHKRRGKGVQVHLVAGRDLERAGLDLDEILSREPGAQRADDPAARQ